MRQNSLLCVYYICDLIKQNESELANIDFTIINNSFQFPLYFVVLSSTKLVISIDRKSNFDGVFFKILL